MPTRCPVVTAAAVLLTASSVTAQLDWLQAAITNRPMARHEAAMTADATGSGVLLFGGSTNGGVANDTWRWSGNAWQQLTPANKPPARYGPRMVTDTTRNVVVMFGGVDQLLLTPFGDTWEWNGQDWTQRTPAGSPAPRSGHAMAFDNARSRTVLFGGRAGTILLDDTWEWDGTQWQQQTPTAAPPAQEGHDMAYDAAHGFVVMAGLTDIVPVGSSPTMPGTYKWNGTRWFFVGERPPGNGGRLTYDAARERVVLYGGEGGNGVPAPVGVWDWDGRLWHSRTTATNPPLRFWHMLAYDPSAETIVAFGGRDDTQPPLQIRKNDTWLLGPVTPARTQMFGTGCSGSQGILELDAPGRPWLGSPFLAEWRNTPSATLLAAILGGSNQSWGTTPLPLDLGAFGMPGCDLLVAPDAIAAILPSSHGYTLTIRIPANTALLGQTLYLQGMALDPTANAGGAIASNGLEFTIGSR